MFSRLLILPVCAIPMVFRPDSAIGQPYTAKGKIQKQRKAGRNYFSALSAVLGNFTIRMGSAEYDLFAIGVLQFTIGLLWEC